MANHVLNVTGICVPKSVSMDHIAISGAKIAAPIAKAIIIRIAKGFMIKNRIGFLNESQAFFAAFAALSFSLANLSVTSADLT